MHLLNALPLADLKERHRLAIDDHPLRDELESEFERRITLAENQVRIGVANSVPWQAIIAYLEGVMKCDRETACGIYNRVEAEILASETGTL